MEFVDRTLKCVDCSEEFIFTAGEQLFFSQKQFVNDPRHCKKCKTKFGRGTARPPRETKATCFACGIETIVPFKPTQNRPVLCRVCFQKQLVAQPLPEREPALSHTSTT